ncbi:MAG: sporulation protein YunB [Clostridia bacterium]|nr:sporulation protein YunB [Clostridia bacterium]
MKLVKINLKILLLIFAVIGVISFATVKYIEAKIMPRGAEVLHSYAETNMFEILNSTVDEVIEKYSIDYDSLVNIIYSDDGSISALEVNYALVNKIKSEISMLVSKRLSDQDEMPVYVPMGAFSQNMYLIGKGPSLKFKLVQRGYVQTDFEHQFESAGVNQTMHTLKITLDADVALMLPFYSTHTYMQTSAILSQMIINGESPDRYFSLYEGEP